MSEKKLPAKSTAKSGPVMPAEWEPHRATWLSWPHNTDTWPNNLAETQSEFLGLVQAIANDESVFLLCPAEHLETCGSYLETLGPTRFPIYSLSVPTNDAWIRDYGPTMVRDGDRQVAVDWQYNAWGGKYPPFEDDQKVVCRAVKLVPSVCQTEPPISILASDLCIEGGAIEMNSDGTLLTTKSCVLNDNRNAGWSCQQVEVEFRRCLGAKEIVWLNGVDIEGDDTDGHIDQLARFVPGNRLIYTWADKQDAHFPYLEKNLLELQRILATKKLDYELIALRLPPPIANERSRRLPASYCNFYITNQSVIVPQFGDEDSDGEAIQLISKLFGPIRKAIGLPSLHIVTGLGSFHCLTQQQPV